jgi:NAD(P)-dependent dehydrogenase (short-subunit alcohol dehydrogenase family)
MNKLPTDDFKICLQVLTELAENGEAIGHLSDSERIQLFQLTGKISRPNKEELDKRNKEIKQGRKKSIVSQERLARSKTGIREARKTSVFKAPLQITDTRNLSDSEELHSPRNCYVCKAEYTKLHFFYDSMCPTCAEYNYLKRFQKADLRGQVALITGARLKIGYHSALLMLRSGAEVIVTTRFPVDAAIRFSKESDFPIWKKQLHVYGLDLRHTPSVEIFTKYIYNTYSRLDILINNAAQTVRRPPGFYSHLMKNETQEYSRLPLDVQELLTGYQNCIQSLQESNSVNETGLAVPLGWNTKTQGIGILSSAQLSLIEYSHDSSISPETNFPSGQLDSDLQQVDLRSTNSWRLKLGEINIAEMIELQLINSIAPFVLCNHLLPLMRREQTGQKHIVNVSAMEGKFHRFKKADRHPHTNMAKAALNMLTHTSAATLAKEGIFMNAVDTGWVTDEDPIELNQKKQETHDFQPPLDIVDGAARVCDPFFAGINSGEHQFGKFLKDYFPIDW